MRSFDTAHLDSIFRLVAKSDGSAYATASADKLITIRNAKTHEIEMRLEGHTGYVLAAAFSPEGKRIATAGDDEEIKVWNLETGKNRAFARYTANEFQSQSHSQDNGTSLAILPRCYRVYFDALSIYRGVLATPHSNDGGLLPEWWSSRAAILLRNRKHGRCPPMHVDGLKERPL